MATDPTTGPGRGPRSRRGRRTGGEEPRERRPMEAIDGAPEPIRHVPPLLGAWIVGFLPSDADASTAATSSRDADTIEAPDATRERLRGVLGAEPAPPPGEDGMTRIGGDRA